MTSQKQYPVKPTQVKNNRSMNNRSINNNTPQRTSGELSKAPNVFDNRGNLHSKKSSRSIDKGKTPIGSPFNRREGNGGGGRTNSGNPCTSSHLQPKQTKSSWSNVVSPFDSGFSYPGDNNSLYGKTEPLPSPEDILKSYYVGIPGFEGNILHDLLINDLEGHLAPYKPSDGKRTLPYPLSVFIRNYFEYRKSRKIYFYDDLTSCQLELRDAIRATIGCLVEGIGPKYEKCYVTFIVLRKHTEDVYVCHHIEIYAMKTDYFDILVGNRPHWVITLPGPGEKGPNINTYKYDGVSENLEYIMSIDPIGNIVKENSRSFRIQ
jgi:hypothetical protein